MARSEISASFSQKRKGRKGNWDHLRDRVFIFHPLHGSFESTVEPQELLTIAPPTPTDESHDFERQLRDRKKADADLLAGEKSLIEDEIRRRIGVFLRASSDLEFNPNHPQNSTTGPGPTTSQRPAARGEVLDT